MAFITLLWRLVRRRWVRRMLLWLVVRLLRLFGWRRVVRLLARGRGGWRLLALGAWRTAIRLLRLGRSVLVLIGSAGAWTPRRLGRRRAGNAKQRTVLSRSFSSRVAHRRDNLRRSLLAAVGVDPGWRPKSRRRIGDGSVAGHRVRSQLGETSSS